MRPLSQYGETVFILVYALLVVYFLFLLLF